jgi:Flp pilus assembly protein TadD
LLELNDYEPARADLEEALRLKPTLPKLYTLVGTARDKTGAVKEAEAAFREALKTNPDDFEANLYLGAILYKRRDVNEAKGYLDHALKLKPADSMARYEAAMLKSTSGEYETAAKELESLVKDDPDWLEPHVELATLYYRLHRPDDGAKERQIVDSLTAKQQAQGPGK